MTSDARRRLDQNKKIKRITTIVALQEYWHEFPELRLGQLIANVIPRNVDLFYVTDDDFVKYLEDFAIYQREIKSTTKE